MSQRSSAYLPVYLSGMFGISPQVMLGLLIPLWALRIGASPILIGFAVSAAFVLPAVFSISMGALVDRAGSRTVLLHGAALVTVLAAAFPLLPHMAALIVLQLLYGFVAGLNWIAAQTGVAQLSARTGNPAHHARFSFFANAGTFAGPLAMGLIWDLGGPWAAFGGLSLWGLCFFFAALRLPRDGGGEGKAALRALLPRPRTYYRAFMLLALPGVALVAYATFLRLSAYAWRGSFYLVYLETLDFSASLIAVLYSALALVSTFSALAAARLSRRLGEAWLLCAGLVVGIVPIMLTPLFEQFYALLALSMVSGFGLGLTLPLLLGLLARCVRPEEQGLAVGLRSTTNGLAQATVPIVLGFLVAGVGLEPAFYVVGGLLLAPALVIFPILLRRLSRSPAP